MTLDAPHSARVNKGSERWRSQGTPLSSDWTALPHQPGDPRPNRPSASHTVVTGIYGDQSRQGLGPRSFQTSWPSLPELPGKGQETLFF